MVQENEHRSFLGVDLGTANTAAAHRAHDGDETKMIMPREGQTISGIVFPSFVEFDMAGDVLYVGKRASENDIGGGSNTIVWGTKRLIGFGFEQARQEFRRVDYPIRKTDDGGVLIVAGPRDYTPEDIAAIILQKVWNDAIDPVLNPLGERPTKVAVSHPANFDSLRVQAIKEAAERVFQGAEVEVVSEPLAAALAYGVEIPPQQSQTVCVLDWGAGTMDAVTGAMTANEAGEIWMSPEPARGKANLGGMDIDDLILDWAIAEYGLTEFARVRTERARNADAALRDVHRELSDLRRQLERAKIRLSKPRAKPQEINAIYQGRVIDITLTRQKLEEILETPLSRERLEDILQAELTAKKLADMNAALQKTRPRDRKGAATAPSEQEAPEVDPEVMAAAENSEPVQVDIVAVKSSVAVSGDGRLLSFLDVFRLITLNSLTLGGYGPEEIDTLLLVGGPMHMPCVREAVKDVFYQNPAVMEQLARIDREGFPVNPMECVARGAAVYAAGTIRPLGTLNRDYSVPMNERTEDGRTVIYIEKNMVAIGDSLPAEGWVEWMRLRGGDPTSGVKVDLLEGKADETSADPDKRVWYRKGGYQFYPAYDSSGKASFKITLRVEEDAVTCICYDQVSKKEYRFAKLNRKDGERVDVRHGLIRPAFTKEEIEQIRRYANDVILIGKHWSATGHSPEEEGKRPEIQQMTALLEYQMAEAPRVGDIEWTKNEEDKEIPRDSSVSEMYDRILSTARQLHAMFPTDDHITQQMVEDLKNLASYQNQRMNQEMMGNPKVAEADRRSAQRKSVEIEHALKSLQDAVSRKDLSAAAAYYAEARSRIEELRNIIDTASK